MCVCGGDREYLGSAASSQSKDSNARKSSTLEYFTCIPGQVKGLQEEEEEENVDNEEE
jgi:hypothetical protein